MLRSTCVDASQSPDESNQLWDTDLEKLFEREGASETSECHEPAQSSRGATGNSAVPHVAAGVKPVVCSRTISADIAGPPIPALSMRRVRQVRVLLAAILHVTLSLFVKASPHGTTCRLVKQSKGGCKAEAVAARMYPLTRLVASL
jgi:hypothetical protein